MMSQKCIPVQHTKTLSLKEQIFALPKIVSVVSYGLVCCDVSKDWNHKVLNNLIESTFISDNCYMLRGKVHDDIRDIISWSKT